MRYKFNYIRHVILNSDKLSNKNAMILIAEIILKAQQNVTAKTAKREAVSKSTRVQPKKKRESK